MEITSDSTFAMDEKQKMLLHREVAQFNKSMGKPADPMQAKMGQNDFLKLLVTQLSKQDPLNPMQNTEFVAQMAQFSQLEQSLNMSKNIQGLRDDFQKLQTQQIIGKNVTYLDADANDLHEGIVDSISFDPDNQKTTIQINGKNLDFADVKSISNRSTATDAYEKNQPIKN